MNKYPMNPTMFRRVADRLATLAPPPTLVPDPYDQGAYLSMAPRLNKVASFTFDRSRGVLVGYLDRDGEPATFPEEDLHAPFCLTPCCLAGWTLIVEGMALCDLTQAEAAGRGIEEIVLQRAAALLGVRMDPEDRFGLPLFAPEWPLEWALALDLDKPPTHPTFSPTWSDAITVCRAIADGCLDPHSIRVRGHNPNQKEKP